MDEIEKIRKELDLFKKKVEELKLLSSIELESLGNVVEEIVSREEFFITYRRIVDDPKLINYLTNITWAESQERAHKEFMREWEENDKYLALISLIRQFVSLDKNKDDYATLIVKKQRIAEKLFEPSAERKLINKKRDLKYLATLYLSHIGTSEKALKELWTPIGRFPTR